MSSSQGDPKGSFVRWQSITIGQLTYAINIILGFSVAALGFETTFLLNGRFDFAFHVFLLSLFSLFFLAVAFVLRSWAVVNRLRDFRVTTAVARKREEGATNQDIESYRSQYKKFGKLTWCLFYWQIGTFGVGIILLTVGVFVSLIQTFIAHLDRQTIYADLALGMSMAKVEYAKGEPDYVSYLNGQSEPGSGASRVASEDIDEATLRKHFNWQYGKPYGAVASLEMEFDPNTRQLRKIDCYDLQARGSCPSLMGIKDGATEDEIVKKFGTPTTHLGRKGFAMITYSRLGAYFMIIGNKVVALGIDKDAS